MTRFCVMNIYIISLLFSKTLAKVLSQGSIFAFDLDNFGLDNSVQTLDNIKETEQDFPVLFVSANTYKEIPHGLGTEPDYVIVQVQIQQGLFSEAIGEYKTDNISSFKCSRSTFGMQMEEHQTSLNK